MEEVTEKTDKCPKWKITKKLKFFVCLAYIVQIAALRAMIVVRYHLNKTVQRWKVPKVAGVVNEVLHWRGPWFYAFNEHIFQLPFGCENLIFFIFIVK